MTPEEIEARFSEQERHLIQHDVQFKAVLNLLQTGAAMLVDMEVKMNALIDSQTKLYGSLQELKEAQQKTDAALRKFIERSGGPNGRSG
jgi:hypothetical protein